MAAETGAATIPDRTVMIIYPQFCRSRPMGEWRDGYKFGQVSERKMVPLA